MWVIPVTEESVISHGVKGGFLLNTLLHKINVNGEVVLTIDFIEKYFFDFHISEIVKHLSNMLLDEEINSVVINGNYPESDFNIVVSFQIPSFVNPNKGTVYKDLDDLYILKKGDFYKIGRSKNPTKRKNQINISSEIPVEIHAVYKGFGFAEKKIHDTFSHKKTNTEWFKLNETDLQNIKMIINEIHDKH